MAGTIPFRGLTGDTLLQPSFYARKDGTAQSVPSQTVTKITFNTEEFDEGGVYDNSTNYRFTPGVAGVYLISASIAITNHPAGKFAQIRVNKNGSLLEDFTQFLINPQDADQDTSSGQITFFETFNTTDYIEMFCYQNSSDAENTRLKHECRFMAFRIN
tara:strand:- start:54 stop:530 length:477 start_codon:yes stop_codon:yes gene_type:complete